MVVTQCIRVAWASRTNRQAVAYAAAFARISVIEIACPARIWQPTSFSAIICRATPIHWSNAGTCSCVSNRTRTHNFRRPASAGAGCGGQTARGSVKETRQRTASRLLNISICIRRAGGSDVTNNAQSECGQADHRALGLIGESSTIRSVLHTKGGR
jgi:hypothetical protein